MGISHGFRVYWTIQPNFEGWKQPKRTFMYSRSFVGVYMRPLSLIVPWNGIMDSEKFIDLGFDFYSEIPQAK